MLLALIRIPDTSALSKNIPEAFGNSPCSAQDNDGGYTQRIKQSYHINCQKKGSKVAPHHAIASAVGGIGAMLHPAHRVVQSLSTAGTFMCLKPVE